MATSLLALLDDIATILDDVSVMSKVAAQKTAGVLGDDLALNAQQVTGVQPDRELPVVWAVFKGSLLNKLILVPLALAISALAAWLITPLLMLGGLFLCYEGVEKLLHKFLHGKQGETSDAAVETAQATAAKQTAAEVVAAALATEKEKIKGAVRTDFILSAEIVVIALGSIPADTPLLQRVLVLSLIALCMTVGVYGLVAAIVKADDLGMFLHQKGRGLRRQIGYGLLQGMPWLMRGLSVVGTLAMFLVGGGILTHAIAPIVQWQKAVELSWGGLFGSMASMLVNLAIGVLAGAVVLAAVALIQKIRGKAQTA